MDGSRSRGREATCLGIGDVEAAIDSFVCPLLCFIAFDAQGKGVSRLYRRIPRDRPRPALARGQGERVLHQPWAISASWLVGEMTIQGAIPAARHQARVQERDR